MLQLYKSRIIVDKNQLEKFPTIMKIVKDFKAEEANKIVMYIYLMYDRSDENPLKDFPSDERQIRAKKIAFKSDEPLDKLFDDKTLKLIIKGAKEYEKETVDSIQKDIDLYDKKMYEFIKLLNENEPQILKNINTMTGKVTFSTNMDIITTVLDNAINIILDKAALTHMKKTGKYSSELRGGLSPNSKGKLKI